MKGTEPISVTVIKKEFTFTVTLTREGKDAEEAWESLCQDVEDQELDLRECIPLYQCLTTHKRS